MSLETALVLYAALQQKPDPDKINPPSNNKPIEEECKSQIKHSNDIYSGLDREVIGYLNCGDHVLKENQDRAIVFYATAFDIIKKDRSNYDPKILIKLTRWLAESFRYVGKNKESVKMYREAYLGIVQLMAENVKDLEEPFKKHYKQQIKNIIDALIITEPPRYYLEKAQKILEQLEKQ